MGITCYFNDLSLGITTETRENYNSVTSVMRVYLWNLIKLSYNDSKSRGFCFICELENEEYLAHNIIWNY